MPLVDRTLALALIRALGVTNAQYVRRVTLNIEWDRPVTIEVERVLPKGAWDTRVERLRLHTSLEPAELQSLADELKDDGEQA